MIKYSLTLIFFSLILFSINAQNSKTLDVQAHAGGKGLYPGNSIPAFINSIKSGAHTLEMDCVISQDSLVVISHDPFMHHLFMLTPSGREIEKEKERDYNIFKMPYDSVRQYQLGSKFDPGFPHQNL